MERYAGNLPICSLIHTLPSPLGLLLQGLCFPDLDDWLLAKFSQWECQEIGGWESRRSQNISFFPFSLLWTISLVVAASPLCPQFPLNISWYCQAILPGLLPPVMAFVSTAFSHWPTGSESDSGFLQLLILGLPPLPPVLSSSSNLRFLPNLNTIDILGWMVLCCRGCPVCYKMISSIHGPTLSTRYQEPQRSYDDRMSSDICQNTAKCSLGSGISPNWEWQFQLLYSCITFSLLNNLMRV